MKRCQKEYTIKFLRSCVPGERTQEEQNYCRLRGGGEVEEDKGRDNSATTGKKKRQNALDFGLHTQPYMLPTKGTNCTEVSNNFTKY